jgi:hypothetical protein
LSKIKFSRLWIGEGIEIDPPSNQFGCDLVCVNVGHQRIAEIDIPEFGNVELAWLEYDKFRDVNFSDSLMTDIDTDQIASELVGWGINFDTLSNPETGELDFAQCEILMIISKRMPITPH